MSASQCYASIKPTSWWKKECVRHIVTYQSMSTVHLRLIAFLIGKGQVQALNSVCNIDNGKIAHLCEKWTCCIFTMLYDESIIFSWCSIKIYLKRCFSFMYKENYISICITFDVLWNSDRKVPVKLHWKTRRKTCLIPVFSHSSHMEMLWSYKNGLQCVCIKLLDVWATVHMGVWSSSLLLHA